MFILQSSGLGRGFSLNSFSGILQGAGKGAGGQEGGGRKMTEFRS